MMYYVNCSCVPSEAGGPIRHSANCEIRQLPMSCVESSPSASPNQCRQQLVAVVSHPGSLVPLTMTTSSSQSNEAAPTSARFIFQASPATCESLPCKPVAGASENSQPGTEYFEELASSEEHSPSVTKSVPDWSESHVRMLLDIFEKERSKFLTRGLVRKRLWEEIAQKLNRETGLQLKGCHCENKWKVLMRGYRRAEKEVKEGEVDGEQFRKSHPLFYKIKTILAQDYGDGDSITARDVQRLSRESRMVWKQGDTRRLLHHYGNFRKRQKNANLTTSSWERIADLIRQEIPTFSMNGSHCYSRFRFLRIKYQRAMLLSKDEASRWSDCPLFNELHAVLWEDPLPSGVPLTPSQIAKKKREHRANEPPASETEDDGPGPPSVIQLEPPEPAQEEFTAYLAKLVDGLAATLRDRAMQDILGYVFNFRKKIRLSNAAVPLEAATR